MKSTAIALILFLTVLQYSNADARSRKSNDPEDSVRSEYIFFYGGINSRPDTTIGFAGFPEFELSLDDGKAFGGGIGTQWYDFRFEGEIGTRSNDVPAEELGPLSEWDFSALSFMLNGYYDIDVGLPVKPYVGVGIGFAQVKSSATGPTLGGAIVTGKDNNTVPAYQFMGGVIIDVSDAISFFGTYRYFETTDATINEVFLPPLNSFEMDFTSEEILAGIFFRF